VSEGGYTLVTLPRIVTPYRDSVVGTRDRKRIKGWLRGHVTGFFGVLSVFGRPIKGLIRLWSEQVWTCNVTLHVHICSGRNRIIPLMWRPNTESTPNKPVMWLRNQPLIRYAGTSPVHTVTIRCYDTRQRYKCVPTLMFHRTPWSPDFNREENETKGQDSGCHYKNQMGHIRSSAKWEISAQVHPCKQWKKWYRMVKLNRICSFIWHIILHS
jgi:hypothetical protein